MFWFANPNDPDEDPGQLFFYWAQSGSVSGMEKVISENPEVLFMSDPFERKSALHIAAASFNPNVDAVRWLLEKGIPWSATDMEGNIPEELARLHKNEEACTVLRNWAIEFEYELYYRTNHPDEGKPFTLTRTDTYKRNAEFCTSPIMYLNPHGAPEDEVALVAKDATGIMMEWERPIMRETARLLLDRMPTTGLRVLNIGFGIGMIDTYFQDAQPAEHVIIEGHPTCLSWMRQKGWYDRPGVRILEGRWQDFFPSGVSAEADKKGNLQLNLLLSGEKLNEDYMPDIGKFDIVYFDTFEEGYRGHFAFIKNVPGLLRGPGSRFSFFNGHAGKADAHYQIYMEVSRLHHNDLGMNTEWFPVHVDRETKWYNLEAHSKGVQVGNKEPQHTIPICALAPTVRRRVVRDVGWKYNRYAPKAQVKDTV